MVMAAGSNAEKEGVYIMQQLPASERSLCLEDLVRESQCQNLKQSLKFTGPKAFWTIMNTFNSGDNIVCSLQSFCGLLFLLQQGALLLNLSGIQFGLIKNSLIDF